MRNNRANILKQKRLGEETYNNDNELMKIIEYNTAKDIVVEFQDENKTQKHTSYGSFIRGQVRNPSSILQVGDTRLNNQGCLMKIIEYQNNSNVVVQFIDKYGAIIKAQSGSYKRGQIKNPYAKTVYGHGMIGEKYHTTINNKATKEYTSWRNILKRSFSKQFKLQHPTYQDVTCCDEWLLFDNFYEWLHEQSNFDKWNNNSSWSVDKDIIVKGNKIYSPNTCCLVPQRVNVIFTKRDSGRGELPIGITKTQSGERFVVQCENPLTDKHSYIGTFDTIEDAFNAYKTTKESIIKQIAKLEFDNQNITKECYDAMMNYKVEILD